MTTETARPNYRLYDRTGGGATEDIHAENLADAIDQGREWIAEGDWTGNDDGTGGDREKIAVCRTISLDCMVSEIVYRPAKPSLSVETENRTLIDARFAHGNGRDSGWQVCVAPSDVAEMITLLAEESGGAWSEAWRDEVGDVYLRWTPPADAEIEEDEEATRDAKEHDCSGEYSDPEPECPVDEGWDFRSTREMGDEFGCRGHGGTAMTHYEVCRNTGIYRDTYRPGSQRNDGEPLEVATYRVADDASTAWVKEQHVNA